MDEVTNEACTVLNPHFLKERQEWLELYQSTCHQIGGKTWRQKNREELLTRVESRLWQMMRSKGLHHVSFRRKCQLAREALTP
jgi:hypothetical protein